MNWSIGEIEDAMGHTQWNEREIRRSQMCVCIHCESYFVSTRISQWANIDGDEQVKSGRIPTSERATAFCPNCGTDTVIGDASDLPIQSTFFLQAMNKAVTS